MILWYKNSFLASVISILGSIVALGGIASFEDDPTITVIAVIAGIALLIAAMSAEGTSRIENIGQIDRGYEKIETRLNALGAHISRV